MAAAGEFDPIAILRALDDRGARYIVIGALGRVIHGSPETTGGLDVVPSLRPRDIERLGMALGDLDARRSDGARIDLEADLQAAPFLDLTTSVGGLKLVPEPVGTQGYDDLRRGASREPLGRGVRPAVASLPDHARMLTALERPDDLETLQNVRRLIELERQRTRSRGLSRER